MFGDFHFNTNYKTGNTIQMIENTTQMIEMLLRMYPSKKKK